MSPDRLVTPERSEDDTLEASLRPKRLADFVGQQQARENLSVFIEAAKARAAQALGEHTEASALIREALKGMAR